MSDYGDLLGDPVDLDDIVENYGRETEQDELNEYPTGENIGDESSETNKIAIQPKKKILREKRPILDPNRLRGEKGLVTIERFFKDFKFKGKRYEKEDLDRLMSYLGLWCHQLYPKYQFDDCLQKIETLGSKKIVQTYIRKIRQGIVDDFSEQKRGPEESESEEIAENLPPGDDIDMYLNDEALWKRNDDLNSKHTFQSSRPGSSQQSQGAKEQTSEITEELKLRIERNKQLAIERRRQTLQKLHSQEPESRVEVVDISAGNANSTCDGLV